MYYVLQTSLIKKKHSINLGEFDGNIKNQNKPSTYGYYGTIILWLPIIKIIKENDTPWLALRLSNINLSFTLFYNNRNEHKSEKTSILGIKKTLTGFNLTSHHQMECCFPLNIKKPTKYYKESTYQ